MRLEVRQQKIEEVVCRMSEAFRGLEASYVEVILGFHGYLRMQRQEKAE